MRGTTNRRIVAGTIATLFATSRRLLVAAIVILAAACSDDDDAGPSDGSAPVTVGETADDTASTQPTATAAGGDADDTASTQPTARTAGGDAEEPLAWTGCEGIDGFECATLSVPRDWAEPDGEMIDLALIRLPATVEEPEGSVVVSWGGPGVSGLESIQPLGASVQDATGGRFDIVSWDPRGLHDSEPILCPEGNAGFFNADPTTLAGIAERYAAVQERSAACFARYGDYLGLLGTDQVAGDLDAIREALGEEELDFLGLSYGTRVGSVYAALFPENVGHMVLDGSLAPLSTLESTAWGDVAAFDAALNVWFQRCAANPPCAFGDDPAAGFDALVAEFRANPPLVPGTDQPMTVGLLYQVFLAGIINFAGSTEIAEKAIAEYRATGDPTILYQIGNAYAGGRQPDGTYASNSPEIFQFVNCIDWSDRPTLAQINTLAGDAAAVSPRMGAFAVANFYLNSAGCPLPARGAPVPTSTKLPPIMVVGATTDGETPLNWSQQLASQLPNSFLLVSQSFGHTAFHISPCVAELVGEFLLSGELPTPGTICPPPD